MFKKAAADVEEGRRVRFLSPEHVHGAEPQSHIHKQEETAGQETRGGITLHNKKGNFACFHVSLLRSFSG